MTKPMGIWAHDDKVYGEEANDWMVQQLVAERDGFKREYARLKREWNRLRKLYTAEAWEEQKEVYARMMATGTMEARANDQIMRYVFALRNEKAIREGREPFWP
jgi:hypothetical protein